MATSLENHLLKGRYRLLQRLNEGGMGAVYQAKDTQRFDATVAIKVLHQRLLVDPQLEEQILQRFATEARVNILLGSHPNIITVFDYCCPTTTQSQQCCRYHPKGSQSRQSRCR
ncbi:MAG: hypothetical protein HC924_08755 [Synechococcaceae cyanobacterium SM2_3_2]|nr:hypothetical protein [Synechococcaceae cyanobacterium SM2_3_2]